MKIHIYLHITTNSKLIKLSKAFLYILNEIQVGDPIGDEFHHRSHSPCAYKNTPKITGLKF